MRTAPYGSWVSPITSDLITQSVVRPGSITVDGLDVYWLEQRPTDGGRNVIVKMGADGKVQDVLPAPFNARSLAQEYGGGAFTVSKGTIYFCNFQDQRIFRVKPNAQPEALTAEGKFHYADMAIDERRQLIFCIREDHTAGGEPPTQLVSISLNSSKTEILSDSADFFSSPKLSPDGSRLAWMTWNHPNMPWDESDIWLADVTADGALRNPKRVAGGPDESVFQPEWAPDGTFYYISDRSGWWNLYTHDETGSSENLIEMPCEFGTPQWVFGLSTYAIESTNRMIVSYNERGIWKLATFNIADRRLELLQLPFTDFSYVKAAAGKAYFLAGSPTQPRAIVQYDLSSKATKILRKSIDVDLDTAYLSTAELIEFDTEQSRKAYAFFYASKNKDFQGPEGELPPLIVKSHGGPTSACSSTLDLGIQFWTSRGFAVVDVNYGGSTGFGRRYRERLNGGWGVVDVDDCINAARFLVKQKRVDENKLAITGGSAGGYTTLCALTFRDVFHAGASHYGVSDLEALAKDTHKFESRYLDRLVGPYPKDKQIYVERSPINYADRLRCPVIFLQGLEDRVVPPNQSEAMVDALRNNGIPVAYVTFEGEQHGFRKAENIKRALDSELYFYSQIFKFKLPGTPPELLIDNLDKPAMRS